MSLAADAAVLLGVILLLQATGKKARFPEAKRFVSLPFSFAGVTKAARGLNCDEVRCDGEKKKYKLLFFFLSIYFVHLTALGLFPCYNYPACSKIRVPV